ncbi:MAG: DNA-processing protein DprA [Candidatus Omnitrophica bacterium]|nr:DNA-processing protein DprA [Candidatus Omnitrophota bacterium]
MAIRKITIDDAEYPKLLRNIHKPPKQLYVNGSLLETDEVAVALVGSRRASLYGLEMSEKLGYELASRGVTVVSGMARGIDTAAHRGALKAKGRTIAVMGSGHGHIYPSQNKKLYEEIVKQGAVLTEFENDMEPLAYNFPQRNRIISGLSLGVVVIEAAKDSGALITASLAAEQGREVFALPGKISSSTSSGTNSLIKDGARLVQSVDDILEELRLHEIKPLEPGEKDGIGDRIEKMTKAYLYNSLTGNERKVYKAMSDEPMYIDDIVASSGIDPANASKALLSLQLKKLILEVPGKQYVRKEN